MLRGYTRSDRLSDSLFSILSINSFVTTSEGKVKKVSSFDYVLLPVFKEKKSRSNLKTGAASALSTGKWYKVSVTSTGIHKIKKDFFTSNGIDVSGINPKKIRVFGNSTGMLPENLKTIVPQTLMELAVYVEGESDEVFNDNDYIFTIIL